jgi:hypothetical protein
MGELLPPCRRAAISARCETGEITRLGTLTAKYKRLFRSSPEAAILAVYGMIHLILLLAAAEVEQVKSLLHALGLR